MHFCFVEIGYPRPSGVIGGAGTYVHHYSKQLVKMNHEVTVICGKMDNNVSSFNDGDILVYPIIGPEKISYYIGKIPIIRVFSKTINYLINGLKIYSLLNKINSIKKIDVIEYSEGGDFWNSITKKFRYISHLHGSSYTFKQNSGKKICSADILERKLEHYFIKNAGLVLSPCKAMVKIVETEMKVKLNAQVIPYPMDVKHLDKITKRKFVPNSSKIHILFASRNDSVKGGELLVDSLRIISSKFHLSIKVDFFGYSPIQNTSDLNYIQIHDFVPENELNLAYKKADICVIPSIFDNSPYTVYEAMVNGKIVVASSVGGIPEVIGDSSNGLLFTNSNVMDLANKLTDAIELILSGNDMVLRKNAQKRIINIASIQNNIKNRLKFIKQ